MTQCTQILQIAMSLLAKPSGSTSTQLWGCCLIDVRMSSGSPGQDYTKDSGLKFLQNVSPFPSSLLYCILFIFKLKWKKTNKQKNTLGFKRHPAARPSDVNFQQPSQADFMLTVQALYFEKHSNTAVLFWQPRRLRFSLGFIHTQNN